MEVALDMSQCKCYVHTLTYTIYIHTHTHKYASYTKVVTLHRKKGAYTHRFDPLLLLPLELGLHVLGACVCVCVRVRVFRVQGLGSRVEGLGVMARG